MWLATSNDAYGLSFTTSPQRLILNLEYMVYSVEKTLPVAWLDEKLLLL